MSKSKVTLRVVALLVVGISLYVVAPSLISSFSAWPELTSVAPGWFALVLGLEAASFVCMWWLQRLLFHRTRWYEIATSQLAGFSMGKIVPGGGAAGVALQLRMLRSTGVDTGAAATGLAAFSVLQTTAVLGLPLLTLPFVLGGARVDAGLAQAAVLGAIAFVVVAGFGACALFADWPLVGVGSVVTKIRNRLKRDRVTKADLTVTLIANRNTLREVLGRQWKLATLAVFGKILLDYLALLSALHAVGANPHPALVLLAYTAQGVMAMVPFTPGGLGFVEAGLTAALVLAGVSAAEATLAVLFYRLASYWIPLGLGGLAYVAFTTRPAKLRSRPRVDPRDLTPPAPGESSPIQGID